MNWNGLQTYGEAPDKAFETLCNQLFRRFLYRSEGSRVQKFRVVNGAGGDGGVESYGELDSGEIVGVQSKWFLDRLGDAQFGQIEKSIITAIRLRPAIKRYIVCVPRNVHSLKYGRGKAGEGKKSVEDHEDKEVDDFFDRMSGLAPGVKLEWWFEADIELELAEAENEGIRRFWFEKEVITHGYLEMQFSLQKAGWLHDRYIPELHAQGVIKKVIDHLLFNNAFQDSATGEIQKFGEAITRIRRAVDDLREVNDQESGVNAPLKELSEYLDRIAKETVRVFRGVADGDETFRVQVPASMDVSGIWEILSRWRRGNKLRQQLANVLSGLSSIRQRDPSSAVGAFQRAFGQSVRLILGDGGTGKTHGLARAVEDHLKAGGPAVIVRAKGTPCGSWNDILRAALQLNTWEVQDILIALEARAELLDRRRVALLPGCSELLDGETKVLVAVDGLEEEFDKRDRWYERIRECQVLAQRFPKLRFAFSARSYFKDDSELPDQPHFKVVKLPKEGDVPVREVASNYFTHFGITGVSATTVKGIERLFGLRLFCELHRGRDFRDGEEIVTAEYELLNEKIRRVEETFARLPGLSIGNARSPIGDSLEVVADSFYGVAGKVEHKSLAAKLKKGGIDYLPAGAIDQIIDHLVNHGFIVRIVEEGKRQGRKIRKTYYSISYEPIVELLIAARIREEIHDGQLDKFPPHTSLQVMSSVCQQLFEQDSQLIGVGGFLTNGLAGDTAVQLQLGTLSRSPKGGSAEYVRLVEDLFTRDAKGRNLVMVHLILPASVSGENLFGADFLHSLLTRPASIFARDKIWIGPDVFDTPDKDRDSVRRLGLPTAFQRLNASMYKLPSDALHNETPLVYAWALATLDQSFREKIRAALYKWALAMPDEYILLLSRTFPVADPQMQEDLASITLGLAGNLKDRTTIHLLAQWALKNVFSNVLKFRNVIVRQGFQAIVERAHQFGLISESEVKMARPRPWEATELLELDTNAVEHQEEQIYPIVHDLAWYVIKDAFEDFFEYPKGNGDEKEDQDGTEAKELLDRYRAHYGKTHLYGRAWAMAAALAYIRHSLGFDRTTGNWSTQESHGSKSTLFTFEEKYTWLAVHYLKGYLSDFVPLKGEDGKFIESYVQIVHIPNPAETVPETGGRPAEWWIPETLSEELDGNADIEEELKRWIEKEPVLDWGKWLEAEGRAFRDMGEMEQWTAIYNWTALHDSSSAVYTAMEATACLVRKGGAEEIVSILETDPDRLRFIGSLDRLKCEPDSDTYSNPSDLVWMPWIGEVETGENYYHNSEKRVVEFTVTKVSTKRVEGEKEITIPSKVVRAMLQIVEMQGERFNDISGSCISFRKEINEDHHDQQEVVLVNRERMKNALADRNSQLVWFVDLWKRKNMSNEDMEDVPHVQRGRKYFVWKEDGKFKALKFWDDTHL